MASFDKHTFVLLFFFWISLCSSFTIQASNQQSLVVGSFVKLRLSNGLEVKSCPKTKHGNLMVCERVHIHGFHRFRNLNKFAHSVIVKVSGQNSGIYFPKAEVCFHRNISLDIGMCPGKKWERISNGSWARFMSPFDHKFLDLRTTGSSLESFEVSIEEEFDLYRVIYLVSGIVLMSLASFLSHSLVFYYGCSMATGPILVILVAFFQGMKKSVMIIPTGPKTSLLIYSSVVGFLSFLMYHYHVFWLSILMEVGLDEILSYAIGIFLLASVVLDGAWLGFWLVRKCLLTEEGSIDLSTAQFVAWSVRIFAALLILQSTVDPILAAEALAVGIVVSSILRRIFKLCIFRRSHRKSKKVAKGKREMTSFSDSFTFDDSLDEDYMHETPANEDSRFPSGSKKFIVSPSTPANRGFMGSDSSQKLYISSFHTTPERRRFSKPEWENFTRESTVKAVEELVSSPDFGRWASKNTDRITVTPPSGTRAEQGRKWLRWF